MMPRRLIIVLLAGFAMTPSAADQDAVYESLDHIPIGRIFLTPAERARLDSMRGREPIPSGTRRLTDNVREPVPGNDAAGYIVSDSGTTRVWKNGDFVATGSVRDVQFPGLVPVDSQPVAQDSRDTAEVDAAAEVSVGDEDEEQ